MYTLYYTLIKIVYNLYTFLKKKKGKMINWDCYYFIINFYILFR